MRQEERDCWIEKKSAKSKIKRAANSPAKLFSASAPYQGINVQIQEITKEQTTKYPINSRKYLS